MTPKSKRIEADHLLFTVNLYDICCFEDVNFYDGFY